MVGDVRRICTHCGLLQIKVQERPGQKLISGASGTVVAVDIHKFLCDAWQLELSTSSLHLADDLTAPESIPVCLCDAGRDSKGAGHRESLCTRL